MKLSFKNIDINTSKSHDNNSLWICNVLQRIKLGWSGPVTVQKIGSALKGSYHLIYSTTTVQRMM